MPFSNASVNTIQSSVKDCRFLGWSSLVKCDKFLEDLLKKSQKFENYDKVWYDNLWSTTISDNSEQFSAVVTVALKLRPYMTSLSVGMSTNKLKNMHT